MIGLPSLQAMDRAQGARIWMASEATDMRCGFDRLAERVRAVIGENPQSGHLFVFRSRRGDRLKILVWDRDGFVLWYKRLEVGVFKIPRSEQGARSVELRASELAMILDGIDVSKLKRVPRCSPTRWSMVARRIFRPNLRREFVDCTQRLGSLLRQVFLGYTHYVASPPAKRIKLSARVVA